MDRKYEMIPEGNKFRIRALRNFSGVTKGELGGLIEKEYNLSHYGDCWIAYDARVSANAQVIEDAKVSGRAIIKGNACVMGNALVTGCAQVYGYAIVEGNSAVKDATVCDAHVYGRAYVYGRADIYGGAEVSSDHNDYIVFKNWWSSGRYFTWTRSNNMWKVGCFHGTGEELIQKAYQDDHEKGKQYEKIVAYVNSLEL